MARVSSIDKNNKREALIQSKAEKRARLKAEAYDRNKPLEERFDAIRKLSEMPRNSAKIRHRNRCALTGRPRGVYRKFKISRIALRDLGNHGLIPGLTKSSW